MTGGSCALPVNGVSISGVSGSLLAMLSVPLNVPTPDGANVIVTVADEPGGRLNAAGDGVNSAESLEIALTCSTADPRFSMTIDRSLVDPTMSIPKSIGPGGSE